MITSILLVILILLTSALIILQVVNFNKVKTQNGLIPEFEKIMPLIREEFSLNRDENLRYSKTSREEMAGLFKLLGENVTISLKQNEEKTNLLSTSVGNGIKSLQESQLLSSKEGRIELAANLKSFEEKFSLNVKEFNELQRQKFNDLLLKHETLRTNTEAKLEKIRETVEKKLESLQLENTKKLEEMRLTVDEKLQNTLNLRLSESFKQVSERLELVHKGLGEMQSLATGVGDLKKVLTNVKTRGIFGEIQLGNILENILTPDQYDLNVAVKPGSRENVEFAIKLPGRDDSGKVVYLPIDSKYPIEAYHTLTLAYEAGDIEAIKSATKLIEIEIKRCAKSIREKYLCPPHTTDFGILFLPSEGLYAEVVRQTTLIETLQRDYKIIITGPTTLAALLNSLQMGFRTLVIEKRSSEVWSVLSAVKVEFGKFGEVLRNAQTKLLKANEDIETLVGTRTRQIQRQLRNVHELPQTETKVFLNKDNTETIETEEE